MKNQKKCFLCESFFPKQDMYLTADGEWLCEICFCDQWDGLCPQCGHVSEELMRECTECSREFFVYPAAKKR
jgi:hypothetical protein